MSLAFELQEQITAYLAGQITLTSLREWLDVRVQTIEDAGDDTLDRLADRAWILFAELDRGHRSELDVRRELLASLSGTDATRLRSNVVRS